MGLIEHLIQQLEAMKGDLHAQAAAAAEFLVSSQPEATREALRPALDAAAVLRWFDAGLLGKVLEIPEDEARARFEMASALPFVETYRGHGREGRNLHESTRLGWRKRLAREAPERFRLLSGRAAACFAGDVSVGGRIEWIYHLVCGDPDRGGTELEKLDREWSGSARPEDRYTLAAALKELEDSRLLQGRARVWALLSIAWTRVSRGEEAQLTNVAQEVLELARSLGDQRSEADAQCLLGDVLEAQGKLAEAQAAFGEYLRISRRLAEQDPTNACWQRELAVACLRMARLRRRLGSPVAALPLYEEAGRIFAALVERAPGFAEWARDKADADEEVARCRAECAEVQGA